MPRSLGIAILKRMALIRIFRFAITHLAIELIAIGGAIGYILLQNALPEVGGRLLAGLAIAGIVASIAYGLVRLRKDH